MIKQCSDFNFKKIFDDGRKLQISLSNASVAEFLILLKLAEHSILSLLELQELRKKQKRKELVENTISDCMEKIKCREKN